MNAPRYNTWEELHRLTRTVEWDLMGEQFPRIKNWPSRSRTKPLKFRRDLYE